MTTQFSMHDIRQTFIDQLIYTNRTACDFNELSNQIEENLYMILGDQETDWIYETISQQDNGQIDEIVSFHTGENQLINPDERFPQINIIQTFIDQIQFIYGQYYELINGNPTLIDFEENELENLMEGVYFLFELIYGIEKQMEFIDRYITNLEILQLIKGQNR